MKFARIDHMSILCRISNCSLMLRIGHLKCGIGGTK